MQSSINYYAENIAFRLKNKFTVSSWIKEVITTEGKTTGNISFIFCKDDYLLKLNKRYLNHDTLTDIITFDYSSDTIVSGDVYISIERVKDNSVRFKNTCINELYRVMIHGILHLTGNTDHNPSERLAMTAKEETCLEILKQKYMRST